MTSHFMMNGQVTLCPSLKGASESKFFDADKFEAVCMCMHA